MRCGPPQREDGWHGWHGWRPGQARDDGPCGRSGRRRSSRRVGGPIRGRGRSPGHAACPRLVGPGGAWVRQGAGGAAVAGDAGARVEGGLRAPDRARAAARVRRCVRIRFAILWKFFRPIGRDGSLRKSGCGIIARITHMQPPAPWSWCRMRPRRSFLSDGRRARTCAAQTSFCATGVRVRWKLTARRLTRHEVLDRFDSNELHRQVAERTCARPRRI